MIDQDTQQFRDEVARDGERLARMIESNLKLTPDHLQIAAHAIRVAVSFACKAPLKPPISPGAR